MEEAITYWLIPYPAMASQQHAEDYLREFLPVPAEHGILCAVALGYSDFEPAAL